MNPDDVIVLLLGEKPYACDICSQRFRISSDMKRHRANVHFKGSIPAADESATRKIVAAPKPKSSSKKRTEESSSSSSETENDEDREVEEEVIQVAISQTIFQVGSSKKLDHFIIALIDKSVKFFGLVNLF